MTECDPAFHLCESVKSVAIFVLRQQLAFAQVGRCYGYKAPLLFSNEKGGMGG